MKKDRPYETFDGPDDYYRWLSKIPMDVNPWELKMLLFHLFARPLTADTPPEGALSLPDLRERYELMVFEATRLEKEGALLLEFAATATTKEFARASLRLDELLGVLREPMTWANEELERLTEALSGGLPAEKATAAEEQPGGRGGRRRCPSSLGVTGLEWPLGAEGYVCPPTVPRGGSLVVDRERGNTMIEREGTVTHQPWVRPPIVITVKDLTGLKFLYSAEYVPRTYKTKPGSSILKHPIIKMTDSKVIVPHPTPGKKPIQVNKYDLQGPDGMAHHVASKRQYFLTEEAALKGAPGFE
jgi:hypothetical protein